MNEPVIWQQIVGAVVIVGGLAGLWTYFHNAIIKVRDDADGEIADLRQEMHDYKLNAANNFAQNNDINAVEIRMLGQVTNVAMEVRYLRESIDKLLREMATQRGEA